MVWGIFMGFIVSHVFSCLLYVVSYSWFSSISKVAGLKQIVSFRFLFQDAVTLSYIPVSSQILTGRILGRIL